MTFWKEGLLPQGRRPANSRQTPNPRAGRP